jgi:hypothetical protein
MTGVTTDAVVEVVAEEIVVETAAAATETEAKAEDEEERVAAAAEAEGAVVTGGEAAELEAGEEVVGVAVTRFSAAWRCSAW